jgi:methionyl-tRNA formyltransferase
VKNKSIIFMGTADFSLKALAAIHEAQFNIAGVYTQTPKPFGRNYKIQKSVVHKFAEEKGIPVYCPENFKPQVEIDIFRSLEPNMAIVSSYGLIIPKNLLSIPACGFINIHASLLPRWRGASPIQAAILAGDKKAGITIMKMDAGVDTGDIISTQSIDIFPETTFGKLSEQLGNLGAKMILKFLGDVENNLQQSRTQPEEGATYAKKITKDLRKINWNDSAVNILRHIKAFSPLPAAWMEIEDVYLKILDAVVLEESTPHSPGVICENMVVSCRVGSLRLTEVQSSGTRKMSGEDFVRGRKDLIGKIAK